jgi:hypothetical protein
MIISINWSLFCLVWSRLVWHDFRSFAAFGLHSGVIMLSRRYKWGLAKIWLAILLSWLYL